MIGREGEVLGSSDRKSQRADLSCSDGGPQEATEVLSAPRGEGGSFAWANLWGQLNWAGEEAAPSEPHPEAVTPSQGTHF